MRTGARSITLRLTIALGAIAFAVFAVAGLLLYTGLARQLEQADREDLLGKVELIKHLVDEARISDDSAALKHHLDDTLLGHGGIRAWLLSPEGTTLYGGKQPAIDTASSSTGLLRLRRDDGVPMEGVQAEISGPASLPISRVLVAIDLRPREQILSAYRGILGVVCTLGVLFTLLLSALAARRGLAPVKRLSREAGRIGPDTHTMRLSGGSVDVELVGLVHAFNGALDRLEKAYRHVEAFNADVAHELRTPLATLINGAQVALSAHRTGDELRDTLASHLEELEQLKTTVNDMLFLARADQGNKARDLQRVELADEVAKTVDYFEALLEESGLSVRCEGLARTDCNPSLIRRALSNLLSNAIKHTAAGETLIVRIEPGETIRLSVFNPGPPLHHETAARMFERFFRADQARGRLGESHGLGLAIVRAIAGMHGGRVFAETSDKGNTVGFEIPLRAA